MVRPPTAWAERLARRPYLLNAADRLAQECAAKISKEDTSVDTQAALDDTVVAPSSSSYSCADSEMKTTGSASQVRHDLYPSVLRGAALADLPDIERDIEMYQRVTCPVLLLTIEGDKSHPIRYVL
jgi:hypothetical protein